MKTIITTEVEKKFDKVYLDRLQSLQNNCKENFLIYTKLPFSFAIKHNLCYMKLMFHPEVIGKHKPSELPDYSLTSIIQTLESVILYELQSVFHKNSLPSIELLRVIKCYRVLTNKLF